jgi:hypothetical protein
MMPTRDDWLNYLGFATLLVLLYYLLWGSAAW